MQSHPCLAKESQPNPGIYTRKIQNKNLMKESYITIDYTGFLPTGETFDSTEKKGGKPLSFRLGDKQIIPGIEEVVAKMKPGEEVQAFVPAALAYGDKGVCTDGGECLIKPGTNLKYFIRLVRVAAAAG